MKKVLRQDPQADDQGLRHAPAAVRTVVPPHPRRPTLTANLVRNLWSHSVIMCGHFPEGVETFERRSIEGETRGEWYLRQMLGSANISGSKVMHFMTGNLSHQIEHHLFPDLPSNRYAEVAPQVRDLFQRYGLTLHHRPAAEAGRLGLAEGDPAVAAQRLREAQAGRGATAPDRGSRRGGSSRLKGDKPVAQRLMHRRVGAGRGLEPRVCHVCRGSRDELGRRAAV